jgi:hypothetical protein
MRQLKIDLPELELAFDSGSAMLSYYLDLETDDIISVSDEDSSLLESIYEPYFAEQTQNVNLVDAFSQAYVPDCQVERLQDADQVKAGISSRNIAIPSEGSH